jgi:hypothetical protein
MSLIRVDTDPCVDLASRNGIWPLAAVEPGDQTRNEMAASKSPADTAHPEFVFARLEGHSLLRVDFGFVAM